MDEAVFSITLNRAQRHDVVIHLLAQRYTNAELSWREEQGRVSTYDSLPRLLRKVEDTDNKSMKITMPWHQMRVEVIAWKWGDKIPETRKKFKEIGQSNLF